MQRKIDICALCPPALCHKRVPVRSPGTALQAEQVLQDRLRLFNSSDYRPSSSCTLREYAENRWLPEVLPTLKHSTKKHYQYALRVHVYPALGGMQLRLINRDAVQDFISAKLRSGLSWRTVKGIRTVLGTVMSAAEMAELIPSNPVRKTRFPRRGLTKPGVTNPEALVFATRQGSAFDRHNLTNRQLKATCKKLGLVGVNWHWLRHANATLLDAVGTPLHHQRLREASRENRGVIILW